MIFNVPNTKNNRIAAAIAIALGLVVGFYLSVSDKDTEPKAVSDVSNQLQNTSAPASPDMPQQLALEDIDFSSYSSDLANYIGFQRGESRISAIDKVRLNFASRESEIVQTSTSSFDREDGSVMIFSVSGLKDDSVKSQQVFLILQGAKGDQQLEEYGMRIKCHRGENTTDWQTDLCP